MSFPALTMLNADRIAYFYAVVHQKSVLYVDSSSLYVGLFIIAPAKSYALYL